MITRDEVYQKAAQAKVDPSIIEKDYHLGVALKIIAENPATKDWVFRGGTALKKCYFTEYRFSEDLDFTLFNRNLKTEEEVKTVLEQICNIANQQFGTTLEFFSVKQEREDYSEEAFKGTMHFQSVKGKSKIKIDLSFVNKLFTTPAEQEIFHPYSDIDIFGKPRIVTTKMEEIIMDKLMASASIRTYPRSRDLFDIWYISKNKKLDLKLIKDSFFEKCDFRKIDKDLIYQMDKKHLEQFKKYWEAHLVTLVGDLPKFEEVVAGVIAYRDEIFN